MELYISLLSLLMSTIAVITPFVMYKKQKVDNKKIDLELKVMMNNLGAGADYRYEYILINNSHKTTYIREVHLEYYKFDESVGGIKWIGEADGGQPILPNDSITNFISFDDKIDEQNIFIVVKIYTQEFEIVRSGYYDPRTNMTLTKKKLKKMKRRYEKLENNTEINQVN